MRIAIFVLALFLSGCASFMDTARSTNTFAVCKTADVATTVVGISSGAFVEGNPLMAKLLSHGYMPFVLLSIAVWYMVDRANNPTLTAGFNAVTCPIAARNVWLLVR